MIQALKLRPERPTDASFSPFGRLIHAHTTAAPDFATDAGTRGWQIPIKIDEPLYMVLDTPAGNPLITHLECHSNVAQTFLPLGSNAAALAVAAPSTDEPHSKDVRLFLLDGSMGYILHPGTWHAPDRVPLTTRGTTWMMITAKATQADLANLVDNSARYTKMLSLTEIWGHALQVDESWALK